ncbi:polysaccharide biosynthesis/export family protein [Terriglobus roseus]|uniref:Polysaccharide export outer membrane protein n=1 Tax=Terriglobus roseus TaxID=392734 RepID=A0A1G7JW23_9BACT|nr:polysaccharide biosynthesis/export family protein [Terriglobus roseus]SDF29015.1 polysaccharide export outer membrane protein [Terriglobus roseus]
MKKFYNFILLVSLLLSGTSWCHAQYTGVAATTAPGLNVRHPLTTDQAILFPPQQDMRILPNDVVVISIFGVTPAFTDTERVALDGTIHLPLAGIVSIGGLTSTAAEQKIAGVMEDQGLFHDAQVNLVISDMPDHVVTLVGAMGKTLPVVGQRRLLDVLSAAGGLPETASTVIKIDRLGLAEPIYVDLGNDPSTSIAANVPIFSGDVITTGNVGAVYIVGAVSSAGTHVLPGSRPMTVSMAIASAGGTTEVAKRDSSILVRITGNTRSVVPLRLKDIQEGKAADPVLQADDIILVPTSTLRSIFRFSNATAIVSLAVSMAALLR